jgi:hypothetical protein
MHQSQIQFMAIASPLVSESSNLQCYMEVATARSSDEDVPTTLYTVAAGSDFVGSNASRSQASVRDSLVRGSSQAFVVVLLLAQSSQGPIRTTSVLAG